MNAKLKVLAASMVLMAGQAMASPVNVGGVVWDPASPFDFESNDQMIETIAGPVGSFISGFGRIMALNTNLQASFCPGCELTYEFSGFQLTDDTALGGTRLTFTGGTINVYVDNTPNFNQSVRSTATDGVLWLALQGHTSLNLITGLTGTLHSTATPTIVGVQGSGGGYFDAVGGLAMANFDTNEWAVANGTGIDFADLSYTSSFQLLRNPVVDAGVTYRLSGSNDLFGNTVPEPSSAAIIGLGLLGLGAAARRKKQA